MVFSMRWGRTWKDVEESDVLHWIEPACSINREEHTFYVFHFTILWILGIEKNL
jgi:hypothetical protein